MTYRGLAKGKTIQLDEALPYPEGQPVNVAVEPVREPSGSAGSILKGLDEPPHLDGPEVDEWERAIEAGKLPVHEGRAFRG